MLCKVKALKGFALKSLDGDIGKVEELYFDDQHWAVRYLVANTGGWLLGRQVLISPYALASIDMRLKHISLDLTKAQIENSPSLDSAKPVSRHFEEAYFSYYGWPTYWGGPYMWGAYPTLVRDRELWKKASKEEKNWDPHLRSTRDVAGHAVQALDGEIGHVEDFIVDDDTWAIRYLVIATKNWWPGKQVLVSTRWITRVSWDESKVFVDLNRETIKLSPEYSEATLLDRDYESGLHLHYSRQGYWIA